MKDPVQTVELIHRFLKTRPKSILRLADLWKLVKLEYPDHSVVTYWKDRKKEKHGIPVEVSTKLESDPRFYRISLGRKEVYYTLGI